MRVVRRVELDVGHALVDQPLDLVPNDLHHIGEELGPGGIGRVRDPGLVTGDQEIRGCRQRDFEGTSCVSLQERRLVGGELPHLAQLAARRARGADFDAAPRPLPFERDRIGHEPVDRVGHVGEPRATPHLAVAQNVQADLALPAQRLGNRAILERPQLFDCGPAFIDRRSHVEKLRRTQQASNLFGTVRDHVESPTPSPHGSLGDGMAASLPLRGSIGGLQIWCTFVVGRACTARSIE